MGPEETWEFFLHYRRLFLDVDSKRNRVRSGDSRRHLRIPLDNIAKIYMVEGWIGWMLLVFHFELVFQFELQRQVREEGESRTGDDFIE